MNKYIIEGGTKLEGVVDVHGAKNSALPILAATVLIKGESVIHNCPSLSDIDETIKILRTLGCTVEIEDKTVIVNATDVTSSIIPEEMMRTMRSSIIFLSSILARTGSAEVCYPGGCDIGLRPVDLHLKSLKLLGAIVNENGCEISCKLKSKINGAKIVLPFPSVGATETIIIASSISEGTTTILNAAREPEINDLADFLNSAGASIALDGKGTIIIRGVESLHSTEHRVISDRIVASTYMSACAITGSELLINNVNPTNLEPIFPVYNEMGCKIYLDDYILRVRAPKRLNRVKNIKTMPFPGFPTDSQAVVAAPLTVARGTSVITENIFENRFRYLSELSRFGADVSFSGKSAVISGVKHLYGANVKCTDLRGGAALVIAALAAEGKSVVNDIYHIERGYENLCDSLKGVGANITRICDETK